MTTVSLFRLEFVPTREELLSRLDGKKDNGYWFNAKKPKNNEDEIHVDIWFEEAIETGMRKIFSDEAYEMVEYLREKGKERIVRKVFCFIDLKMKTIEIYRGPDYITQEIRKRLEKLLKTTITPVSLSTNQLLDIVKNHSSEVRQAMFKYIHGLWYHIIRGRHLEDHWKYKKYLAKKPDSLRVVSITPKIMYSNGREYMVTINADKGTIKMSDGFYKYKPRFEIKQIVSLVFSAAGLSF